jgi:hypothetical protein
MQFKLEFAVDSSASDDEIWRALTTIISKISLVVVQKANLRSGRPIYNDDGVFIGKWMLVDDDEVG